MKKGTTVLIIIAAVVVLLVLLVIGSYNGLVSKSEDVERYRSEIDNQLQRRSDLIPNLVATVKQYAKHESEVFEAVSEARAKLAGAGSLAEQADANAELSSALSRLLAIAEAYPELKANENFINLQDELAGTENRIANARRYYNEAARDYNTSIRRFPTNIIANLFGFESVEYFEASEGSRENPNVGDLFGD
ncbi:MAG: LemA family protein [Eubacteriales bacterium]|jgi:LemA protein